MLRHLTVENYALIDKLNIDLDARLNIITGETGAGKSILLGALGLLLGNKNEGSTLRDESRNCVVEGHFDIGGYGLEELFESNDLDYEPTTVIRRVISPAGKSRAFVNDMPVQLTVLRDLGAHLIDIHSQHRNAMLANEDFRISAVDTLAGTVEQVAEYKAVYDSIIRAERELTKMQAEAELLKRDEEWLRFQVEEFDVAALREGELAEAEAELAILENADDICAAIGEARNILDTEQIGALEQLSVAERAIMNVSSNYLSGKDIAERLHSVVQELKDLSSTLASDAERIESDPERLQRLTERVNLIHSMCQKHRVATLEELLQVGESLRSKLGAITHGGENIARQQAEIDAMRKSATAIAGDIHMARESAARELSGEVASILIQLGMPEAQFVVEVIDLGELLPSGCDSVRFLFTANSRMSMQPIEKIASGGEVSRVMLALKSLLAKRSKLPTIIFDEIDTGVSGRIADAMGDIISALGDNMQVVAITHLPQVACKGDSHMVVYKHDSTTNIQVLSAEARVEEIAKMLSGSSVTDAALKQARILLG